MVSYKKTSIQDNRTPLHNRMSPADTVSAEDVIEQIDDKILAPEEGQMVRDKLTESEREFDRYAARVELEYQGTGVSSCK